ncbi:MAG: hypothetical protein IPM74_10470 [Crocinitomicaceae bacterium]|nr:hypothetical protein [Crocinitomicaceae bacterium]
MRSSISLVILFIFLSCQSDYSKRFYKRVHQVQPSIPQAETETASSSPIRLNQFEYEHFNSILFDATNALRTKKKRNIFITDTLYSQIAQTLLAGMSDSRKINTDRCRKERRSVKYILQRDHSKYKACEIFAFKLDILDLELGDAYYYDNFVGSSPINCYKGKIPKKSESKNLEPEPVYPISEQQLLVNFSDKISSGEMRRIIFSNDFRTMGIAVKPIPDYRKSYQRPSILIVLVLGARSTQDVFLPEYLHKEMYNHLNETDTLVVN